MSHVTQFGDRNQVSGRIRRDMAGTAGNLTTRIGVTARNVAVALIAGVCRWRSIDEVNDAVKAQGRGTQAAITLGVLAILLGLSLIAAQFGWIGMLAFWLVVIVLVN
jgi:hypothetical protein